MNRRLKITVLIIAAFVVVGVVLLVGMRSGDEQQLNQNQNQAETVSEFLPDRPTIATSLIQSAEQLAETQKSYNLKDDNQVPVVDYASQSLVAFVYQSPTPGYQIKASVQDGAAEVTVVSPPKGCSKAQVVTPIVAYVVIARTQSAPVVNSQIQDSLAECDF